MGLIEYDAKVRDQLEAFLEASGCHVLSASNAAILARMIAATGFRPEAIVADFWVGTTPVVRMLPDLLDVLPRGLPMIIATSDRSVVVRQEFQERGWTRLLKPYTSEALLAVLHRTTMRRWTGA